jgi:hypothetical protein
LEMCRISSTGRRSVSILAAAVIVRLPLLHQ